jgi:hypothetical protein
MISLQLLGLLQLAVFEQWRRLVGLGWDLVGSKLASTFA